jgi:two-component system LytT family response regulator
LTGYSKYALNAHNLHASGYLMKPIVAEDIRKELNDLRITVSASPSCPHIQTFRNFDMFVDNTPIAFTRIMA